MKAFNLVDQVTECRPLPLLSSLLRREKTLLLRKAAHSLSNMQLCSPLLTNHRLVFCTALPQFLKSFCSIRGIVPRLTPIDRRRRQRARAQGKARHRDPAYPAPMSESPPPRRGRWQGPPCLPSPCPAGPGGSGDSVSDKVGNRSARRRTPARSRNRTGSQTARAARQGRSGRPPGRAPWAPTVAESFPSRRAGRPARLGAPAADCPRLASRGRRVAGGPKELSAAGFAVRFFVRLAVRFAVRIAVRFAVRSAVRFSGVIVTLRVTALTRISRIPSGGKTFSQRLVAFTGERWGRRGPGLISGVSHF